MAVRPFTVEQLSNIEKMCTDSFKDVVFSLQYPGMGKHPEYSDVDEWDDSYCESDDRLRKLHDEQGQPKFNVMVAQPYEPFGSTTRTTMF